ncbi:hypothetical protein D3C81_1740950 [compost metagenome]
MPHHTTVADDAVEQDTVETDEHSIADDAGAVHDRAVGDGTVLTDGHSRAGFGMDDHAVLDIRIGADDDRLHLA